MPATEDELLAHALGALGGTGARFAARFLRTDMCEIETVVSLPFGRTNQLIEDILSGTGQRVSVDGVEGSALAVIVGRGRAGLNPAVVTVRLVSGDSNTTRVYVRAVAKEGFIKQRGASRAASQISAAIETASRTPPTHRH